MEGTGGSAPSVVAVGVAVVVVVSATAAVVVVTRVSSVEALIVVDVVVVARTAVVVLAAAAVVVVVESVVVVVDARVVLVVATVEVVGRGAEPPVTVNGPLPTFSTTPVVAVVQLTDSVCAPLGVSASMVTWPENAPPVVTDAAPVPSMMPVPSSMSRAFAVRPLSHPEPLKVMVLFGAPDAGEYENVWPGSLAPCAGTATATPAAPSTAAAAATRTTTPAGGPARVDPARGCPAICTGQG